MPTTRITRDLAVTRGKGWADGVERSLSPSISRFRFTVGYHVVSVARWPEHYRSINEPIKHLCDDNRSFDYSALCANAGTLRNRPALGTPPSPPRFPDVGAKRIMEM